MNFCTLVATATAVLAFATRPISAQYVWVECPHNDHWYTRTAPLQCDEAEALAVSWGGHLATVRSDQENAWLYDTYQVVGTADGNWIGFTDEAVEGTWLWSSEEPTIYTNWNSPGEPSNTWGIEHYAMIELGDAATAAAKWNDLPVHYLIPGLIELVSDDCDSDGVPDLYEIAEDPGLDLNGNAVIDVCECLATSYCLAAGNSSGTNALIGSNGETSLAQNTFQLHVNGAVPLQFGLFFYSPNQQQKLWGEGMLCVGPGLQRIHPILLSDSGGFITLQIDFTQPPFASGPFAINPLSTWSFQYWYRDPLGGPAGFNFSDGLEVTFCL